MKVTVTEEAEKHYKKLPKSQQLKIKKKLQFLENNALLGKKLGGELANLYALRAWPYRIVYAINVITKEITIRSIQHRQGAYK